MRVRHCCCGFSLASGTKLIATFFLIIYIPLSIVVFLLGLDKDRREEMFKSDSMDGLGEKQKTIAVNIAYGCSLGALVFIICMDILLAVGAVLKNTALLYIWFVIHILTIIVISVVIVVVSFSRSSDVYRRVGLTGSLTVIVFLTIYFLIVVHSFYREIKEEQVREYIQHLRLLEEQQQQQQEQQQQQQQQQQYNHQQQRGQLYSQQQLQPVHYLQQYSQQYPEQHFMQQLQYEQQCLQQQYYRQQQQNYVQQHHQQQQQQQQRNYIQQQQPAYYPVALFTVSSYNPPDPPVPSAPPPS